MKAIIGTKTLKAAVDKAAFAIESKTTLPILANLLISCDKYRQEITVTGTDLENTVFLFRSAEVLEPGSFTAGAKALKKVMASIDDDMTTIFHDESASNDEYTKNMLGVNDYKIVGVSADDFPVFATPAFNGAGTQMISLPFSAVERVRAAISTDETRYDINGINLNHGAITATDGHRLHTVKHSTGMQAPEYDKHHNITNADDVNAIVPSSAIKLLARASYKKEYTGQGLVCGKHLYLGLGGDDYLMVKLVDGEFPDFSQIIPQNVDKCAILDRAGFAKALKAAMVMSSEMNNGIKITLNGTIQVSASNPELGTFSRTVAGDWSEHPAEMALGFNAKLMLDALAQIKEDQALLEVDDELTPAKFTEGDFTAVVMPMRL